MLLMKQKAAGRQRSNSQPFRRDNSVDEARLLSLKLCLSVCKMQFQLTMVAATYVCCIADPWGISARTLIVLA